MSRIGKKAVVIPDGVTATVEGNTIKTKGPKGELEFVANDEVIVELKDGEIAVSPRDDSKVARSKWGMSRTMIQNIVDGVHQGYERKLEISGVGYRAAMQGKTSSWRWVSRMMLFMRCQKAFLLQHPSRRKLF